MVRNHSAVRESRYARRGHLRCTAGYLDLAALVDVGGGAGGAAIFTNAIGVPACSATGVAMGSRKHLNGLSGYDAAPSGRLVTNIAGDHAAAPVEATCPTDMPDHDTTPFVCDS